MDSADLRVVGRGRREARLCGGVVTDILPNCLSWVRSEPFLETMEARQDERISGYLGQATFRSVPRDLYSEMCFSGIVSCRTQELPCISFADGPDRVRLVENLGHSEEWAWIVITSPESADVFLDGWREAGETRGLRVAAVGGATRDRLEQAGVSVAFIPSKATGATLASELPELVPGSLEARILYPCSARAGNDLVESLSTRGYRVTRLNTYDTVPAVWTEAEKSLSSFIQIATFASPSAVQGWLNEAGSLPPLAACIGETSARACMNYMDSEQIFYPEKPGLPGWIDATMQAIDKAESRRENSDA